jgi:acetylxylan esterase
LGLETDADTTDTNVPLGTHQATRKRWKNECGYVTLDAFTSLGGDHGPSDALFKAEYVIPFLGLDKVGAVDPELEQCKSAGGGSGGMAGVGGAVAAGGAGGGCVCNTALKPGNRPATALLTIGLALLARSFRRRKA